MCSCTMHFWTRPHKIKSMINLKSRMIETKRGFKKFKKFGKNIVTYIHMHIFLLCTLLRSNLKSYKTLLTESRTSTVSSLKVNLIR